MGRSRSDRERLGGRTRLGLAALAVVLAGALGLARRLEPDPRGFGTHEQLGLAPCAFAGWTGVSCPSCGMTTAFAWSVRGRPGLAWRANPTGSLLAPTCAALVPWLLAQAMLGRPLSRRSPGRTLTLIVVATLASSLLAWTCRLLLWRAL